MKKLFTLFAAGALCALSQSPAMAQDNLLAEKPIYTLGEAKTWSAGDASYTFITDDLSKLVAVPTNTSNVYLYPENGALNTPENQELGAQGFYIDMGVSQEVGTVATTWEGAAADSYEIYLTDEVPTPAVLASTPTYSVSGLGQYTENTAVLPDGAKGRYLVFQVTKATNWGWGVKIRSISANAPADDVLTTFKVSPSILVADRQTPVTFTILNQFGLSIPQDQVQIVVSDNAVYENGNLTVLSGNSATITASLGGETIQTTVYVALAPEVPAAASIKTPIYSNTVTDYNGTAEFTTDWNGGAQKLGQLEFADGEVAMQFGNTRCVFFSNTVTTGAWNGNINPAEEGYRNLCLDVFSGTDTECTIEFESVENLEGGHTYPFTLKAGEWNPIVVNVAGATKLGNLSIRFTEANAADILLSNIYFTPAYVEGDETAPVLGEITAEADMTSITLRLSATDDLSEEVYYSITDGIKTYATSGASGETVEYVINGLEPSTEYNLAITASDGLNVSEAKTLEVKTTGMPDAPEVTTPANHIIAVYSTGYEATELPSFDAWGSTANMSTTKTDGGHTVLLFGNYMGQWGGLVNLDLDITGANMLNIDIFGDAEDGSLTIAPVWAGFNDTPNKTLEVKAGEWNHYALSLSEFGVESYGNTVIQLALTNSTMSSFAVDNIYFSGDTELEVETVNICENQNDDIYNLQGIRVGKVSDLQTLPRGIYIVRGKKIVQ